MVHDVTTKYQMAREIIVMPKVGPEEKQAGEWLQFFIPRVVMQTHTQIHSYSHYASFSMLLLLLPIIDFFQLFCFFFALDIFISALTSAATSNHPPSAVTHSPSGALRHRAALFAKVQMTLRASFSHHPASMFTVNRYEETTGKGEKIEHTTTRGLTFRSLAGLNGATRP